MVYYGNTISNIVNGMEGEWLIFFLVFLFSFGMTYLSLARFFRTQKKMTMMDMYMGKGIKKEIPFNPVLVLISVSVALLVAVIFVRENFINYLSGGVGGYLFLLGLIVLIIVTILFYKALRANGGDKVALVFSWVLVWTSFKVGFFETSFYNNMSYYWQDIFEYFIPYWILVVGIVVFFIIGLVIDANRPACTP